MIKDGSRVKLHYTLTVDEKVVDSSRNADPLAYVHGQGEILPGLERQLEGLSAGDTKAATVNPEQGYGPHDPSAVQQVTRSAFQEPDKLKQGDVVAGKAKGQAFQATVTEVGEEEITLDLNHPLAGKTLEFEVEIVDVE